MVSLLVLMIAVIFNTTTFAQATLDPSSPLPASSGTNGQGNKVGQLRGLIAQIKQLVNMASRVERLRVRHSSSGKLIPSVQACWSTL